MTVHWKSSSLYTHGISLLLWNSSCYRRVESRHEGMNSSASYYFWALRNGSIYSCQKVFVFTNIDQMLYMWVSVLLWAKRRLEIVYILSKQFLVFNRKAYVLLQIINLHRYRPSFCGTPSDTRVIFKYLS